MKKVLKFGVVLTALVLGLVCLAACSDGGGSNDGGGSVNNNGNINNGNTNNDGEVVVKRTAEATWKSDDNIYTYIFYNDGTYELMERADVITKGMYHGISSPRQQGDLTMSQQYAKDKNSGTLISNPVVYALSIIKNYGELHLVDGYREYSLVD